MADTTSTRDLDTPWVAPETDVERLPAEPWREAFRSDRIGLDDGFFALAGRLVGRRAAALLANVASMTKEAAVAALRKLLAAE